MPHKCKELDLLRIRAPLVLSQILSCFLPDSIAEEKKVVVGELTM